ncbi:MAG: hypothetical protein AAFR97_03540, partial [Bacteroidota bacterium]
RYQSPVDVDQLWAEIEPEVQHAKKNRRWLFLLLFGLIGCLAFWSYFYSSKEVTPFPSDGQAPSLVSQQDNTSLATENIESTHSKEADQTTVENIGTFLPTWHRQASADQNIRGIFRSPHENLQIENRDGTIPEQSDDLTKPGAHPFILSQALFLDGIDHPLNGGIQIEFSSPATTQRNIRSANHTRQKSFPSLFSPDIPLLNLPVALKSSPLPTQSPESEQREKGRTMVYLTAGIGTTQQRLPTSGPDTTVRRRDNEQPLETISLELGARWPLSRKAYASTGIFFNSWVDRFTAQYRVNQEFTLEDVLLQRILNPITGDVQEIFGDTTVIGTRTVSATHYNKYRSFGLAIGLGINVWEHGKWQLDVGMDALLDIRLTAEGKYLEERTLISDLQNIGYSRNRLGWNARAQLSLSYDINSNWTILLAPYAQNRLSNLLGSGEQKITYWRIGTNLGVGYRF